MSSETILPLQNPNPSSVPPPPPPPPHQWEAAARAWLSSTTSPPPPADLDAWIDSNLASLPSDLRLLPRPDLHLRLLSLQGPPIPNSGESSRVEHPYRFQRTRLWKPAYTWLESLETDQIVQPEEIAGWLAANPEVKESLFAKHPRYHLMHYIQKLHMKVLKKRGKLPKGMHLSAVKASVRALNGGMRRREIPFPSKNSGDVEDDKNIMFCKKKEAFLRYELLTDLQNQLASFLSERKVAANSPLIKQMSEHKIIPCSSNAVKKDGSAEILSRDASHSQEMVNIHLNEQVKPTPDILTGQSTKRNPVIVTSAWSHCEALHGGSQTGQHCSHHQEANSHNMGIADVHDLNLQRSFRKNIMMCLLGREKGVSWPLACSYSSYVGRNRERLIPFLEGWRSLGSQFEGPAVWFNRRNYSSWVPTWCAYTSSVATVQPFGRHAVQKVVDVRFHPEGLPQLVCSSNETPNELLLYNLLSGRATQLSGHNCQIQAVDFAVRGASIVSCGSNLVKVWDCITGSCLFTLGSIREDGASTGHTQKINAMTVNAWQSCLVVTSGARGDGKLLLWNALRGELDADLNSNLRTADCHYPSIVAMEFCSENLLVCGSDCDEDSPAVVQLWDIESQQSCQSFPANNSFISSLKVDPTSNIVLTGSGDGTVGLFDIRTCRAINYLSVGSTYEVTKVSFSSCGTYFNASSTSNSTFVWDVRLMPMTRAQLPLERSHPKSDTRFIKPLHCLSHGKQMPTAEIAGQLPGHVDVGDQGVNDARWLRREPVLVTASGDGSITMWDVTLGQPCVRHFSTHSRCANTVTVSPNDEYLCSGGDDQKVVLYHNGRGSSNPKWRLTHPLTET